MEKNPPLAALIHDLRAREFHVMIGRTQGPSLTSGPTRLTQLNLQPARHQVLQQQQHLTRIPWTSYHRNIRCVHVLRFQGTTGSFDR